MPIMIDTTVGFSFVPDVFSASLESCPHTARFARTIPEPGW